MYIKGLQMKLIIGNFVKQIEIIKSMRHKNKDINKKTCIIL